jgi:SAM-dependent methyltransferase
MVYDEFITRKSWAPGERVAKWTTRRLLKEIIRVPKIEPAQTHILEIGSGLGYLAEIASEFNFDRYSAFEPNAKLAALTRAKVPKSTIHEIALPNSSPDLYETFDLIVCIHVIEHAENGYAAAQWLNSLHKMLRPGGKIVIVSPQISDYKGYFWEIDWSHCFPTSNENVSQILLDLNCSIIAKKTFRLGSTCSYISILGKVIDLITPTRMLNTIGNRFFDRPLGTGLKAALLWGTTFVIAEK